MSTAWAERVTVIAKQSAQATDYRICEQCKLAISRYGISSTDYKVRRFCNLACYRAFTQAGAKKITFSRICEVCGTRTRRVNGCGTCEYRARFRSENAAICDYVDREWPDDPIWIRIAHQLVEAHREGRLHPHIARACRIDTGEHLCPSCGIRVWTPRDAAQCCRQVSG